VPNETTPAAGATPAAAGATPAQTTPVSPAADTNPTTPATPATGNPEDLGAAGLRALQAERSRADAAERDLKALKTQLEELQNAQKSDDEKAISQAKKDGAAEASAKLTAAIRRSEVRTALTAAGANPALLDLAAKADEFAALDVSDAGEVTGLAQAVEAFKKGHPEVFGKPATPGTADGGTRGTAWLTREQIEKMTPQEIAARWSEVEAALPNLR